VRETRENRQSELGSLHDASICGGGQIQTKRWFDNSRHPGRCIALMSFLRIPAIIRVVALSAVLILAGDIIADSISDARGGHCFSQTLPSHPDHQKAPCSHCSCAVHNGAVALTDFTVRLNTDLQSAAVLPLGNDVAPPPLVSSIDHPPQLG
jgi:hypothetical protein